MTPKTAAGAWTEHDPNHRFTPRDPGSGVCGICHPRQRTVYEVQGLVVDGSVMAMQEFSSDELTALAEYAEGINPDGWLPKMVREYLDVWRDSGERP